MADMFDPLGSEFVDVQSVVNPQTAAKSSPAAGTLNRSGRLVLNTEGTSLVGVVVKNSKLPETHFWAKFKVNPASRTVAVLAVDATTPGAVDVRRSSDGRTVTLYLHGVFKDYPELRPAGDTVVKLTLHPSGKAVLISLASGGLGVRHSKREGSQEAGTQG